MVDEWYTGFKLVGSVKTHCGFTMILVKATKQALRVHIEGAPAIGALVDGVVFVAMHLMPHKDGLYCRMQLPTRGKKQLLLSVQRSE